MSKDVQLSEDFYWDGDNIIRELEPSEMLQSTSPSILKIVVAREMTSV